MTEVGKGGNLRPSTQFSTATLGRILEWVVSAPPGDAVDQLQAQVERR